jgi:hypothetical protein
VRGFRIGRWPCVVQAAAALAGCPARQPPRRDRCAPPAAASTLDSSTASPTQAFAAKREEGVPAFVTAYPNMTHGFAIRPNATNPAYAVAAGKVRCFGRVKPGSGGAQAASGAAAVVGAGRRGPVAAGPAPARAGNKLSARPRHGSNPRPGV